MAEIRYLAAAIIDLVEIQYFLSTGFSDKYADSVTSGIQRKINVLAGTPEIGPKLRIEGITLPFRRVIYKYYSCIYIYYKESAHIDIVAIFDDRQDPNKLLNKLQEFTV